MKSKQISSLYKMTVVLNRRLGRKGQKTVGIPALKIKSTTQRPKITYSCGCLVHLNGPADVPGGLSICRHYCKRHAKILIAMQQMAATNQ